MASAQAIVDHDRIREWAEARGARPACVKGTGGRNDTGMIRLDFPGFSGADSLQEISWKQWFRQFDDNNLALLVQEKTSRGQKSNFNKLVSRGGNARTRTGTRENAAQKRGARAADSGSTERGARTRGRKPADRKPTRRSSATAARRSPQKSGAAQPLTNHAEIREWAEARGAHPACVKGTGGRNDPGMIRLDFPGFSGGESLQAISWRDWFRQFDENDLALLVQDRTARGQRSNFNKLVRRGTADRNRRRSRSSPRQAARKQAGGRTAASTRTRSATASRRKRAH